MFALFFMIAIYISRSSKNYDHKYTLQCHLCRGRLMNMLMKLLTVNNNHLPLIKIFTVYRRLAFVLIFTENGACAHIWQVKQK